MGLRATPDRVYKTSVLTYFEVNGFQRLKIQYVKKLLSSKDVLQVGQIVL